MTDNESTELLIKPLAPSAPTPAAFSTPALDHFRARYNLCESVLDPDYNQAKAIGKRQGLCLLKPAPIVGVKIGYPPPYRDRPGKNTYLWVIDERGIPYILDTPLAALCSKCPKHTNITAGGPAYIGGELWFISDREMYAAGASGRFPPHNSRHLSDAICVLRSFNYEVHSLGWQKELGRAARFIEEVE